MKTLFAIFLAAALLTGCGARKAETKAPITPDPAPAVLESAPQGLSMYLEHEVYDPSLDRYTYIIDNGTEEMVTLGEDYTLEKQAGAAWETIRPESELSWNALAYVLEPGEQLALPCSFSAFAREPERGEYRLVKTVQLGEKTVELAAEFSLGDSPYTAESPYGFPPLETLPEHYSAGEVREDHVVLLTDHGLEGKTEVNRFVQNVARNIPCQLRIIQEFNEGNTMVMDAIFEQGKIHWKVRSGGGITENCFAYLVTDGRAVCLSNGADWQRAEQLTGSQLVYLLPEGTEGLEESVALIREMTDARLQDSTIRYCVWSPDGRCKAAATGVAGELIIEQEGRGESFDLTDGQGRPTPIEELEWEDGLLLIYTADGARAFDPDNWVLHG